MPHLKFSFPTSELTKSASKNIRNGFWHRRNLPKNIFTNCPLWFFLEVRNKTLLVLPYIWFSSFSKHYLAVFVRISSDCSGIRISLRLIVWGLIKTDESAQWDMGKKSKEEEKKSSCLWDSNPSHFRYSGSSKTRRFTSSDPLPFM